MEHCPTVSNISEYALRVPGFPHFPIIVAPTTLEGIEFNLIHADTDILVVMSKLELSATWMYVLLLVSVLSLNSYAPFPSYPPVEFQKAFVTVPVLEYCE